MEELKKPNQLEEVYSALETSCETACDRDYGTGCACRTHPRSVETEEDILF